MMDNNDKEFQGARIRVLGTNEAEPEEGRIFVWTKTGWFEREEGPDGDVAFTPVAQSEEELREFIARDDPSADLLKLKRSFSKDIEDEFKEQALSLMDPAEEEDGDVSLDEDDQLYHQHDND